MINKCKYCTLAVVIVAEVELLCEEGARDRRSEERKEE